MKNSELFRALRDIQSKDPDGGQTEPTVEMYKEHREWAIQTYGAEAWDTYMSDVWAVSDNDDNGYNFREDSGEGR